MVEKLNHNQLIEFVREQGEIETLSAVLTLLRERLEPDDIFSAYLSHETREQLERAIGRIANGRAWLGMIDRDHHQLPPR